MSAFTKCYVFHFVLLLLFNHFTSGVLYICRRQLSGMPAQGDAINSFPSILVSEAFVMFSNGNTYPKGRALMQMYRVVPQTKRSNCIRVHLFIQ